MRPRYYILLGRTPIAVTVEAWAKWMQIAERHVACDDIGKAGVSTVFLGLDHGMRNNADPLIFETLVFGGPLDGEMRRYSTWAEAERGHQEVVTEVRIAAAKIDAIVRAIE